MAKEKVIKLPPLSELMLPAYIPYLTNKDRYLNFIGSRGSGKSVAAAQIIVLRMLTHKFFRGVGIRKVYGNIQDSVYQTIRDVIDTWGLTNLFEFKVSPFKITCKHNGNNMIFRGLDKPEALKSLREITFVFFEEECCDTLEDFNTIDLSVRTPQADFIQILHCINPILEGTLTEHWFYNFFRYNETNEMSFSKRIEGQVDNRSVYYNITSFHTTYKENKFLPDQYKLKLETETDEWSYTVNTLGLWAQKTVSDRFYKSFNVKKNVGNFTYDRDKPIYLGIDFNVYPYSAIVLYQIEGKKLYQIDEICINDEKESSIIVALRGFRRKYKDHYLLVYIIGDATGKKNDSAHEKGFNNYSIVQKELEMFKWEMMVPTANPSVIARGQFTNEIFANNYSGIEFCINEKCKNTINDFLYLKADYDGTIKKEIVKNKDNGKTYEKYGHCSDSATYILCQVFANIFSKWKNGGKAFKPIMGDNKNKYSW